MKQAAFCERAAVLVAFTKQRCDGDSDPGHHLIRAYHSFSIMWAADLLGCDGERILQVVRSFASHLPRWVRTHGQQRGDGARLAHSSRERGERFVSFGSKEALLATLLA
jgi:hypothetical protein